MPPHLCALRSYIAISLWPSMARVCRLLAPACSFVLGITALSVSPATGVRGQVVPMGFQRENKPWRRRPLLASPFPLCQRQFSLDLRVGTGSFKAFPVREFIFGLRKRKGKQARGVGCRSGGTRSKRASAKTSQARRGKQDMAHVPSLK